MNDNEYRKSETCPGCGKPKQVGCVVCWNCFKYRQDVTPLKYFDGYVDGFNPLVVEARRRTDMVSRIVRLMGGFNPLVVEARRRTHGQRYRHC